LRGGAVALPAYGRKPVTGDIEQRREDTAEEQNLSHHPSPLLNPGFSRTRLLRNDPVGNVICLVTWVNHALTGPLEQWSRYYVSCASRHPGRQSAVLPVCVAAHPIAPGRHHAAIRICRQPDPRGNRTPMRERQGRDRTPTLHPLEGPMTWKISICQRPCGQPGQNIKKFKHSERECQGEGQGK